MKKSLRFEVFRRDGFTCRYCGEKPPNCVLEVDHVLPRAEGGTDEILNLVTACDACNRGKGRKLLERGAVEQNADIAYLEVQQDVAEIERYQRSLLRRQEALRSLVASFQALWCEVTDLDWAPKENILRVLVTRYSPEVVEYAIRDVAGKVAGGYLDSYNDRKWVSYLHAVARDAAADRKWVSYLHAVARNAAAERGE